MVGINKVTLIGNVGNDPEIKVTQDGREFAKLSVATQESWKSKETGERKEKTEWHRIVVFNQGLVSVVKDYIKKGSKLYIEGSLQTRKYTDENNKEHYTTEIVLQGYNSVLSMLDRKDNLGASESISSSFGPVNPLNLAEKQEKSQEPAKTEDSSLEDNEVPF